MKRRLMCVLVVLVGLWGLLSACVDPRTVVPAVTGTPVVSLTPMSRKTPTRAGVIRIHAADTFYGKTADGWIRGLDSVYAVARSTPADCGIDAAQWGVGQTYIDPDYYMSRVYLVFDTSAVPDANTVTGAVLYVCAGQDVSTTDFEVQTVRAAWSSALCDAMAANYALGLGDTLEGTLRDTASGWSAGTFYSMTVQAAGISKTGDTLYILVSSEDRGDSAPTDNEYVDVRLADYIGTPSVPYLEVEHVTPTPTNTPTVTPTPTNTPTPTPTPTVTAICPVSLSDDTTWGPGTVRVECNTGIWTDTVLTITAGTEVVVLGDYKIDVQGDLSAVGTAAEPITLTHTSAVTTGAWSYIHLRGEPAELEYCVVRYGRGINDEAGSSIRHTIVETCTYGLATMSDTEMVSCTLHGNTYGVVPYLEGSPSVSYTNIVSNAWSVYMDQVSGVNFWYNWWGADPPAAARIWDDLHDFVLGVCDVTFYLAGWLSW